VVEPVVGHVIEPLLYGHSTGLSPVAIVASATFWTALWGPIGLVLATPLTVCLVVLGRHVERLQFLDIMFGDRPALSPPEIFYQRMLVGDPTEASDKAEEFLKERSLASYFDEVALKGLLLAQADSDRGVLNEERLTKIRDAVSEFVENLPDSDEGAPNKADVVSDPEVSSAVESIGDDKKTPAIPVVRSEDLPLEWQAECPLLCIAGRSLIDEAAAIILGQLTAAHGLGARIEGPESFSTANIFRLETAGVAAICLIYLDVGTPAHMRFAIRRLRRRAPKALIILVCCAREITSETLEGLRDNARADLAVADLTEAARQCIEAARPVRPSDRSEADRSSMITAV